MTDLTTGTYHDYVRDILVNCPSLEGRASIVRSVFSEPSVFGLDDLTVSAVRRCSRTDWPFRSTAQEDIVHVAFKIACTSSAIRELDRMTADIEWIERNMLPTSFAMTYARVCGAPRDKLPLKEWNPISYEIARLSKIKNLPDSVGRRILCNVAAGSATTRPLDILGRRRTMAIDQLSRLCVAIKNACSDMQIN